MLDFKNYKKTQDNGKTVIMENDKGHQITLVVSALSKDQQESLARLPLHTKKIEVTPMSKGGNINNSVTPENAFNQYLPEKGIVGGTVYSGSDREFFVIGDYSFDIDRAREIAGKRSNAEIPVSDKWLDKIKIDKKKAMEGISTNPAFVVQMTTPNGLKPLLIDANHRMYKAWKEGKKTMPAYVFSSEQTAELFVPKPKSVEHPKSGSVRQKFAKGGDVKNYDDGGMAEDNKSEEFKQMYGPGGADSASDKPSQSPVTLNINTAPAPAAIPDQGIAPNGTPNALMTQDQQSQSQASPQADSPQQVTMDQQNVQATAPRSLGSVLDTMPTVPQAIHEDLTLEDKNWQHDLVNQHITPATYSDLFAKKTTLGKIGTLFGLLVGGAGAGLSHQPNMLMQMMNKEIDNDLSAQVQSKANAQNFLKIHQQQQLNDATVQRYAAENGVSKATMDNMVFANTKNKMMRAAYQDLANKVQNMDPKSPGYAAAVQQLGMLYGSIGMQVNDTNNKVSGAAAYQQNLGLMPGSQNGVNTGLLKSGLMGPAGIERGKDIESKTVPGFGTSTLPVNDPNREALSDGQNFDQKLNRFIDWTKAHRETAMLHPEDARVGATLAAELQGAYRQATHGGVYKEGEQNFISKLINSDPVSNLNKFTVIPQLEALAKENRERVNQKAKMAGLPGYQGSESQGNAMTSTSKSGKPITSTDGGKTWKYK